MYKPLVSYYHIGYKHYVYNLILRLEAFFVISKFTYIEHSVWDRFLLDLISVKLCKFFLVHGAMD